MQIGRICLAALALVALVFSPTWSNAEDIEQLRSDVKSLKQQSRFGEAVVAANRLLPALESAHGASHKTVGNLRNTIAELYKLMGNVNEAERRYLEVLERFNDGGSNDQKIVRKALGNLTLIYMSQGRFGDVGRGFEARQSWHQANHAYCIQEHNFEEAV